MARLALGALAACGGRMTTSGPPTVVCGKTLNNSPAGAVLFDVSHGWHGSITHASGGGLVFLRVSDSCTRGVDLTATPADVFSIARRVTATDGKLAGVALLPKRFGVATQLVFARDDVVSATIELNIANDVNPPRPVATTFAYP